MENTKSLPLYEKVAIRNTLGRALDITILLLLISLLVYRLFHLNSHGFAWLLAFLCESWFTFNWVLLVNTKWSPAEYKTYPHRLVERIHELPPVDMFVTTADSVLEPPIITINTIISLLAIDYPAQKLACYVSDDGCSPLTYYSLVEASKFAKYWVPFCKKYSLQVRAPFRYFSEESIPFGAYSSEFQQEWKLMKEKYKQLSERIEAAAQKSVPCELTGDYAIFSKVERGNHPAIIKIIWENKEGISNALPHLVYVSREKRPEHPHHYKAGAMNVLTRVSGLMTNAPFILNVDCDMYVNDPQVCLHAICLLLDSNNEKESAFVQFPPKFYDGLKDDPFGNQFVALHEILFKGIAGIQGPGYVGTGCFHRRKVMYGLCPEDHRNEGSNHTNSVHGKLADEGSLAKFGSSKELIKSASDALKGRISNYPCNLSNSIEAAFQVAGCKYEHATSWGSKVGWMYGSTAEDLNTGLRIHSKGWKSVLVSPDPPAFLGCVPSDVPTLMTQQKRWSTGLLEVLFSRKSPIVGTLTAKLQFRQCLAYTSLTIWGIHSIPELCYAVLPAYCIITNSTFLPQVHEPAMCIPVALFVIYNLHTLWEYIQIGLSIRNWWNNHRMARISMVCAWLFGVSSVMLKLIGVSETVFEVTQKEQSTSTNVDDDADVGRFTFNESPAFVPGTTILLMQLTALVLVLLRLQPPARDGQGSGPGEVMCSLLLVLIFMPFLKGLFRRNKYGIPLPIIFKSASLTLLFIYFSRRTIMS